MRKKVTITFLISLAEISFHCILPSILCFCKTACNNKCRPVFRYLSCSICMFYLSLLRCVELIICEQMRKYKARLKDINTLEFAENKAKSRLTHIRRSMVSDTTAQSPRLTQDLPHSWPSHWNPVPIVKAHFPWMCCILKCPVRCRGTNPMFPM